MAAVSRGTSHVTTNQRFKYTTSVDIKKYVVQIHVLETQRIIRCGR